MSKIYLVGRHDAQVSPDHEVVGSESVVFPATWQECQPVLLAVAEKAVALGATAVILQASPAQVVKAVLKGQYTCVGVGYYPEVDSQYFGKVEWGSIVAVPSAPDADGKRGFSFHHVEWWNDLLD